MSRDLDAAIVGEGTLLTAFEAVCAEHADRTALEFLGTRYSYGRLHELVLRFGTACRALGVAPGDRALIYLPNSPQWLIAYLGVMKIGAVPVPVSDLYTPRELVYLLDHSGSETVVCADTNFGYVREVLPATPVKRVIVTRLDDLLPVWKRIFGRLFDRVPRGAVGRALRRPAVQGPGSALGGEQREPADGEPEGERAPAVSEGEPTPAAAVYTFRRLLSEHEPEDRPAGIDPAADLAHILYTGGTTGFPKGVPHTHLELLSGVLGVREVYREFIDSGAHALTLPLHLFHMFSLDMVFALGLHRGNAVVVLPRPNADAVLAAVQAHRRVLLVGVPTLYRRLLECPRLDYYDLGPLERCWSAGDVLPVEVAARWRARTGVPIHQVYGSTETVCVTAGRLDREPEPGKVGRLLPTREARVVDPESLEPVPPGEAGELLITSKYSYGTGGYWRNPDESAETYVQLDGRTWCRTGDYMKLGPAGELEFVDRRADLIKHKGFRVSASRVESVLQDHPAVVGACVVGTPNEVAGENVKAFVLLDEDARGVTAHDLTRHCRARLLPYEVPDYIEFRDMLPRSKVGKLLRRELKEEERRKADG